MNIYSIVSLSAFIVCISISILVYWKKPSSAINKFFALATTLMGIWCLFPFIVSISETDKTAIYNARLVYSAALFTPPAFLHFIFILIGINHQKYIRRIIFSSYIFTVLFLIILFNPQFISGVTRGTPQFSVIPGQLYFLFILYFGILCSYTVWEAFVIFRKSSGVKRNQLKYLFLSFLSAFIGGVLHFLAAYTGKEPVPHDIFIIAYVIIMAYAIAVHRLMDINIVIRKMITAVVSITLISGTMILIYGISMPTGIKLISFMMLGALISMYLPVIKNKTEDIVRHILYKEKYKYLDRIGKFIEKMMLIPKEEDLIKNTAMVLTMDMYAERMILLTRDNITGDYVIKHKINFDGPGDIKLLQNSGIVSLLRKHKKAFVLEEEEKILSSREIENIRKELESLGTKVCVPARIDSDLIGIIALGNKTTGEMYTHVDLELLERLGIQLAVSLDYKRIEEELRKEQELAAIGTMSMEISHELRNLLQTPTTFIDLIPDKLNDQDFLVNFRKMALDRIKVISDKLNDIMFFGKERPPNYKPDVDINDLLDANILNNEYAIKKENIEIVKEYNDIPAILADKNQLTHLFNNLIVNAIDAMAEKGGKLRVRTRINININSEMKDKSDQWIRIEIKDDGTGIPDKVLKKLFTPFVTTKSAGNIQRAGTGLGLSVAKKVVDAHKGYVNANTKEGKGTTFAVDLPVELKPRYIHPVSKTGEQWKYKE